MFSVFHYAFIQNALLAGTFIAIVAAVMGYFLTARGLTFAGHALPNIGFAGAAGAVMIGVSPVYGLFVFTIAAAVGIGLSRGEPRERDVWIGVLMTFALALGLMFLALYSGYASRVYSILFGTILGISSSDALVTSATSTLVVLLVLAVYRPLLFSSVDPVVAAARGVPVRFLSIFFLVLFALAVSLSVQLMGAMLVFTLIVGPAATASRITRRPGRAIVYAVALGVAYVWLGIALAAMSGDWPVSFFVATISFLVYLPVRFLHRHALRPAGAAYD